MRTRNRIMIPIILMVIGTTATFANPAFQSSDSATLNIGGNVPERVDIAVTPVDSENLDLQSSVSDRLIATVVERSNVRAGYTVSVESANGFTLKGQADSGDTFDRLGYALNYGGESVSNPGNSFATNTTASDSHMFAKRESRTATPGLHTGDEKSLLISYDARTVNLYDGDYSDTLTFTIVAE